MSRPAQPFMWWVAVPTFIAALMVLVELAVTGSGGGGLLFAAARLRHIIRLAW
jgi:hypothetical protein